MTLAQCSLIRALWAQGLDTYDISDRLGMGEAAVYNYITEWMGRSKIWQATRSRSAVSA